MALFSNDLINGTLDTIAPKVVDTVLQSNLLMQILAKRSVRITGKNKQYMIKYKVAGNGGSFNWFDKLNTNFVDTTAKLSFEPRNVYQPIALSDDDVSSTTGEEAIVELTGLKTEEATQELADTIGTQLYADGTGNGGKDLLGLEAAVKTAGTYGGLSYATYPTLASTVDAATNLVGFSIASLDAMYDSISSGMHIPDLIITTKALKTAIQNFATLTQDVTVGASTGNMFPSRNNGLSVAIGATEVFYRGIPVIADEKCPTGYLYMLNTSTWEMLTQEMKSAAGDIYSPIMVSAGILEGQYDKNFDSVFLGFSIRKAQYPGDQAASVRQLMFRGNLVCKDPRRNGKFSALV